jgi:hypothetical protein
VTEHIQHDEQSSGDAWWQPASLLTPAACAVGAFAIATVDLTGQNLLQVGISALLGQGFFSSNDAAGYYLVWGLSALVPLVIVALLARVTLRATRSGWESNLARASMIVATVAFVGAVLTALGGILHHGFPG